MKIAIDPYMFRTTPLLELPALVAELGFEWIELSPREDFTPFFNHARVDDATVAKFRSALSSAGVGVASVLPLYKWSGPDEDERQAAVRYWKRAIQITSDLGVDTMNSEFNGNPREAAVCERQFWRSMEELLPVFEREGIRLVLEPHPDDWEEDGKRAVDLIRGINSPLVSFLYCAPHTFHQGDDAPGIIGKAGDLLTYVHVADSFNHKGSSGLRYIVNPPGSQVTVHQHLDMGQGEVDFDELFAELERVGFDGTISSSVFAWEDRARESSTLMRAAIDDQLGRWHTKPSLVSPDLTRRPIMSTATRITHLVAGSPWEGTAERTSDVFNPATGEVTGTLDLASADLVGEVVAGAKQAWKESWGSVSLAKRSAVLFKFRELLNRDKERIAALVTAEHGKVLSDALGEVMRGLEVAEFACGIPHLLKGGFSENASTKVDVYSMRQSLGVVAVISPFNFPAMVPLWFVPVAVACGNAVIIKPSEKDPSSTIAIAELWKEAGLPDGIMNVVNGDKEAVDALLTHPDVKSISFVGSTPIARYVYETGTVHGKRVQALGGAKNHMLVLPDADLDLAADAAVNAGFGSAGERCMAISALVAVEPIADELISKIKDRMGKLRTGDGTRGCDMGPLITGQHRDKVTSYVDAGVEEGAELVVDGRNPTVDADGAGFFIEPTLFDKVTPEMSIYTDEIFGPVLSVIRTSSYDEGLELINANPYGNGTAIFTNDGGAARKFQSEVEVGMVGVNVPIPVPMSYYSFGGWKNSLFGDSHAHGIEGVHFFTRGKVVTSRWLDPSHGGLNLGFPQND